MTLMSLSMETVSWLQSQWGVRGLFLTGLVPLLLIMTGLWKVLLALIIAVLAFILGATFRIYVSSVHEGMLGKRGGMRSRKRNPEVGGDSSSGMITYELSPELEKSREPRDKLDMRLSGSAIIDEIIHEMIDFVIRDYVHSWYDYVSPDDEFIHQLRKAMQETLVNLSSRIKEVDWIPFLTTQLVDDAASHLRLYRTALTKVKENPNCDLLSVFFDLEASMEKSLCRDMACIDDSHLNDYFQGISETILYLLLPGEIYGCTAVGSLAQDLLVNYILIPVLNLFSEPDFVNQYVIWLCQGFPVSTDTFLSVIRSIDNLEEITAAFDFFQEQHADLKSQCERTINSDELSLIKSQLKNMNIIRKAVELRLSILKEGSPEGSDWTDEGEGWQNYFLTPGVKLHSLSCQEILKNSVAMSYFLDYMNGVGGSNILLMYLNTSAWKSLAEQQFSALEKDEKGPNELENNQAMMECLKTAASNVYNEFIPDDAIHKVRLPENVLRRLYIQMRSGCISPSLFDDTLESLLEMMESSEKFYPAFIKTKHYIKCLMDLDLLRTDGLGGSDDDEDLASLDEYDISSNGELDRQRSNAEDYQTCMDCLKVRKQIEDNLSPEDVLLWEKGYLERKYRLRADIIEAGLTVEKGKQFGVYAVEVVRIESWDKRERRWHIYRRYSDFYDFHQWIKSKWMRLNKIEFPSKHTFRTTDRMFLEKRMGALNKYLDTLLAMTGEPCFGESLQDALLHFFEPGNYMIKKKQLSDKIETLVNPLKLSVKTVTSAVKSAPDTFISTLDGFTKMFSLKASEPEQIVEAMKVGASIDIEVDDNIPLRIVLLLMDEVFDLKQRNQWLRRRIVAFFREILKAMFGDTINRRIIDNVAFLTNPVKVSGYLRNLQKTLWPGGKRGAHKEPREPDIKMRTRIAAKASLFACLSDELKRLIGSETTRRGLLCVFDMFQNRILNRRFTLVIFEGILKTLFPDKPLADIIQRLHFRSNRVGKNRPFLVPTSRQHSGTAAGTLSPRVSRRKKV